LGFASRTYRLGMSKLAMVTASHTGLLFDPCVSVNDAIAGRLKKWPVIQSFQPYEL